MYNGYITECPPMEDLFWQFVNLKYPDEPEEIHETSSTSLNSLNDQLKAINSYLRDITNDEDITFSDFDNFISYILDNHPPDIDPDVLNLYLNSLETIVELISFNFTEDIVILDRIGSVAILQE